MLAYKGVFAMRKLRLRVITSRFYNPLDFKQVRQIIAAEYHHIRLAAIWNFLKNTNPSRSEYEWPLGLPESKAAYNALCSFLSIRFNSDDVTEDHLEIWSLVCTYIEWAEVQKEKGKTLAGISPLDTNE